MLSYVYMSEQLLSEEKVSKSEACDEGLYESFSEVASFQAYEHFDGELGYRNQQKHLFIEGEIENPQLDYPGIGLEKLDSIENDLLDLKRNLLLNEQNEVVKQAYRWRLNEKIAEVRLLRSVAIGDMKRFGRYSEFIYGKPSQDVFAYTINSVISDIKGLGSSTDQSISQLASELIKMLPEMDNPRISELPNQQTVDYASAQTNMELGGLYDMPAEATKLDSEQIRDAFDTALEQMGDSGWNVVIDAKTSKTGVSVDQEGKQINIPQSRSVGNAKLASLIVHEIGTHVARRINGERSQLKLLGLGLDRYESGDEGVATMREQALSGKVDDFRGIDGLLAVGLALGIDGEPRNFRQVYEILEKYYLLKNLTKGKEFDEANEKAQTTAWNRCVRTFRGTDCKTPGVCFTKDIIYREGNIGVWDVIKNNPEEMLRFNIGKYDPANSRHLWILEQLGISDQDLARLEQ